MWNIEDIYGEELGLFPGTDPAAKFQCYGVSVQLLDRALDCFSDCLI